jgi:hypothetical protein
MKIFFPTIHSARVSRAWGVKHSMYLTEGNRHMGVDFAVPVGTAIYACADGVVELSTDTNAHGYGRHIVIQHDGYKSLYAHLSSRKVQAGDEVKAGDVIGATGGDPNDADKIDGASSGAHLHFEIALPEMPAGDSVKTFLGYTVNPIVYLSDHLPDAVARGSVESKKGLTVRSGPGVDNDPLYAVHYDTDMEFIETRQVGADLWGRLRTLREEWVAIRYKGTYLVELVSKPQPVPPSGSAMLAGVHFTGEVVFDYTDGRQEVWHVTDAVLQPGPARGER